jgi:hypothetical protein
MKSLPKEGATLRWMETMSSLYFIITKPTVRQSTNRTVPSTCEAKYKQDG